MATAKFYNSVILNGIRYTKYGYECLTFLCEERRGANPFLHWQILKMLQLITFRTGTDIYKVFLPSDDLYNDFFTKETITEGKVTLQLTS